MFLCRFTCNNCTVFETKNVAIDEKGIKYIKVRLTVLGCEEGVDFFVVNDPNSSEYVLDVVPALAGALSELAQHFDFVAVCKGVQI